MDLELSGRVALVAAASRGLGRASASALAAEGARVVMCARSADVETAAAEIREETGADVAAVRADVSKSGDIERFVNTAVDRFGWPEILVINAGGPPPGRFLDLVPEDWEAAVQLTLMSAVRLCYAVVPHMRAAGSGSIVAIESISVKQPVDNLILSNALRMAVIGMLKTMANELGPEGIRVNSINPTFTWTGRVDQLLKAAAEASGSTVEEEAEKRAREIPLRRMGSVSEFGRTVAWLASPAASYIHGHALMFDGGATRSSL